MGHLYKRGKKWYLKYYRNGKPHYEATHTSNESVARRLLRKREGEIAEGKLPGIYFDRVRFDELAEDLLRDYEINSRKSLVRAQMATNRLKEFFEGVKVVNISTTDIERYIKARQEAGTTNSTINRELAVLKRMFHLGVQRHPPKVNRVPHIPMLRETNARTGFFEHGEYMALLGVLPDHLKPVLTFGYHTGWRIGEILSLTWDKVDLGHGVVRLNPGETKTGQGRVIYLNQELQAMLTDLHAKRDLACPWVFNREGNKIINYYKAWRMACKKVGLRGKIFHDLRRTAARNLVRSGIPERVAMMITGHKTRSIFDRYNIVSPEDLKEAAKKHEAYIQAQSGK